MAPDSHGSGRRPNGMNNSATNGYPNFAHQPPPSTLAAQLVDNISTPTARSSHPDETIELKRLFAVIEREKNKPDLEKTDQERIEHNHILIYVYTRVVLEGLQWDDPFAKTAQLVSEASKALTFLQVTIDETPTVLTYVPGDKTFLFRGREPLWLWLLPRVLRMLGSEPCVPLTSAIEQLCSKILNTTSRVSSLWEVGPQIVLYLQANFAVVEAHLREVDGGPAEDKDVHGDHTVNIHLVPDQRLRSFGILDLVSHQRCSYSLRSVHQVVRHATSLVRILKSAVQPGHHGTVKTSTSPLDDQIVWLLDSLVSLSQVLPHCSGATGVSTVDAVRICSQLVDVLGGDVYTNGVYEVIRHKIFHIFVVLCSGVADAPGELHGNDHRSSESRHIFALALVEIARAAIALKPVARTIKAQLLWPLKSLTLEHHNVGPESDLCRLRLLLEHITSSTGHGDPAFPPTVMSNMFIDSRLARQIASVHPTLRPEQPLQRPTKRLRPSIEPKTLPEIIILIDSLVPVRSFSGEMAILDDEVLIDAFTQVNDDDRCLLIELLCRVCCAADNTLIITRSVDAGSPRTFCSHCEDGGQESSHLPDCLDKSSKTTACAMFASIVRIPAFLESRRPRVVAMISLRRILQHSPDSQFWDLQRTGGLGQWCTQSLQSSIRELRLAAGRALAAFLGAYGHATCEESILDRNRVYVVGVLKLLSDKNVPHLHETCIAAWGQVGRVAPDEELNLVLLQLLEYLGHRNMIVSAFAFNEIAAVADARRVIPRQLFAPFWRTLGFTAVKDLVSKPQTSKMVAELLHTGVPVLLRLVQTHAIPWLVLTKKREVIQKIAEARGEQEIWQAVIDGDNLGATLALLLVQDVPNLPEYCMSLFRHVSPHFEDFNLVNLLGSEPTMTALELLKACGDADEARKPRIRAALSMIANLLLPDDGRRESKTERTGRFFQQHALGLTARLSDVINDLLSRNPPVQERRRHLKAMEEMIRMGRYHVRIARQQVATCLLSALAHDELRAAAFSCWHVLLTHMEDEDVESLLETTFFVIHHYWHSFSDATRQECKALLTTLLDKFQPVIQDLIDKLPSLKDIKDLASINKRFDAMRIPLDTRQIFSLFAERLSHEHAHAGVVLQALNELADYLKKNQGYLQTSAISDQPDSVIPSLTRALLDCSAKFNGWQLEISRVCAECIGLVGCLDSNRVEAPREQKQFVVVDNFGNATETTDFVSYLLEHVLVKAFLSATDPRAIGYLSYAMQELLESCDFKLAYAYQGGGDTPAVYRKWLAFPEATREVLTPFLNSRFSLAPMVWPAVEYPLFTPTKGYNNWLRSFCLELLKNGQTVFAQIVFEPLCRCIRVKDVFVAEFLLPYLVVHVVIGEEGTPRLREMIIGELQTIMSYEPKESASFVEREDIKHCYQAVFSVLDYAMRWLQAAKAKHGSAGAYAERYTRIQSVLDSIHPELIARRAVHCKQYSLALFHLEPHVRRAAEEQQIDPEGGKQLIQLLQDIYVEIDDPDGLEGIFASMHRVDINQQILSHKKAGRWESTQTWYEIRLAENPDNIDVQLDLLTCLKESGQHDVLLNYVEGMNTSLNANKIAHFAVEASWATGRWETLRKYLSLYNGEPTEQFSLGVAQALLQLKEGDKGSFQEYIQMMRDKVASELSQSSTASFRACHDARLKCHVLSDLEIIANHQDADNTQQTMVSLQRRLEVLGAYVTDKQYLLGIRRAAMELKRPVFTDGDISSLWLSSARLARKAGSTHQSFNAVLHATQLGDGSATIENARLLWKDGHHRKAIQLLNKAIDSKDFINQSFSTAAPTSSRNPVNEKSLLTARAYLLLAKWQDSAGQTHASAQRLQYQEAAKTYVQWEKGHYYLGRHYKKILESEKALKPDDQSDEYLSGETAKLVIENYLRSLNYGTKYLYQTLPRVLTLWLELGAQLGSAPEGKTQLGRELFARRATVLRQVHTYISKTVKRLPTYIFYTALPQIVARIAHPNPDVFHYIQEIIVKVVEAHPRQALWNLFACMTTKHPSDRKTRGQAILHNLRKITHKVDDSTYDLRQMLRMGEKLAEQLLLACNNGDFQSNRTVTASITRDLNFNHKCTPCPLVVPIEASLTATLPTLTDNVKKHKAFSRDVITIESFLDEVLVLGSLAKPRKLTARGSDGHNYGLLIKPKDDLRTDQRLMEFNSMINRSLKRDAESSRRQLYIRTYAVTPLNEECGIIEWVDGLKTLRDILLGIYKTRGISPNYQTIAQLMKEAAAHEKNLTYFTETVIGMFPAVLPEWFISQFPNPEAWFAARLRYTRSCAVMSMVGTILGLGDRHGENLLLEEGNGGIFHVDFNCLFDKGLTFAQPERVPFRLTHNMVAAMGIYGVEGPFRQCSELTLKILRAQEETLMTILEAFIYDPTLDLQKDKKRKNDAVRLNPTSVVESIRRKVRGLLPDESIPLGVEGQVEELVKAAMDPRNLTAMYIGWCPFL
ncbi:protein kinase rad3, partial [Coniochaeta sp. 2T2.1]